MSARLAALVLAAATFSPATAQAAGRKVALLIGVNKYDNRNLDELKFAEPDVVALAAELEKSGFVVRTLRGSEGIDPAKRVGGKAAYFDALKESLRGVTKNDVVLLAFSGHGVQLEVNKKESPFFCPADAVPTDASTLISINEVLATLGERGGGHNLLLIDACRNVVDPNRGARGGINGDVAVLPSGTAVGRGTAYSSTSSWKACAARPEPRTTTGR
jgi:uncharacterized caspase-like protein